MQTLVRTALKCPPDVTNSCFLIKGILIDRETSVKKFKQLQTFSFLSFFLSLRFCCLDITRVEMSPRTLGPDFASLTSSSQGRE